MILWLSACAEYPFEPGPDMLPGDNCRGCHKAGGPYEEAPEWTVAGTVFVDPEGTAGAGGVTVRITGDDGRVIELSTRESGNFYTSVPVAAPYRVELERDGASAAMPASPPSGGCNACHAASPLGGAPGALWLPEEGFSPTLTCDGDATLLAPDGTSFPCSPYRCDPRECRFGCEGPEDCADGAVCDGGRCL